MNNQKKKFLASEFDIFKLEMKYMYDVTGKRMLKETLKVEVILILAIYGLFHNIDIPGSHRFFFAFLPIMGFLPGYLLLYLVEYRPMIRNAIKESKLRDKYDTFYKKFIDVN